MRTKFGVVVVGVGIIGAALLAAGCGSTDVSCQDTATCPRVSGDGGFDGGRDADAGFAEAMVEVATSSPRPRATSG